MSHSSDKKRPASEALNALTASAMALPGLAGFAGATQADGGPVTETTFDHEYSFYDEDDLRPRKTVFGADRERMEIHSYQFRLTTPVGERADADVAGTFESLSGGSPWFVLPDSGGRGGRPVQVMSEPTIDEERGDLLVTGNYYFDQAKVSASIGGSIESDYYSVNFGLGSDYSFNDKNSTLSIGASTSLDWIEPTDCKDYNRVCSEDKQSVNVYLGLSQVMTRHSAIQSTISFGYADGFLSDPYKQAWVEALDSGGSGALRDSRPDDRKQFTWLTKYRHHISRFDGTLHLDYKLYADDWDVTSHTFDVSWYQSLPWNIQIVPSFRYYSQSQAEFYEVYYETERSDGFASSDYRLSPYGAVNYGLKATWDLVDFPNGWSWQLAASYDRYESSAGMAFQRVDTENPGLVSFRVYSARITAKF